MIFKKKTKVKESNVTEVSKESLEKKVNIKFTIIAVLAIIIFSAVLVPISLQNFKMSYSLFSIFINSHFLSIYF